MTFEIRQWDGQPITEPGLYAGIDIELYHQQLTAEPSISSSGLRTLFMDSPRHYFRDSYLNPNRKPRKESEAFTFGRACHHLLLGESDFDKLFEVRPTEYPDAKTGELKPWNGNATWCRNWLAERAGKKTVLTQTDIENVRGMAASLNDHPMVQDGCLNGLIEHSLVWQDTETGVWLKWRPDAIPGDSMLFTDLKSCASVSDQAIEFSISDYAYEMQAALGALGCREVLGRDMEAFSLMFCEKSDPWCARHKTLRPGDLEDGIKSVRSAIRLFARCIEKQKWPGPGGDQTDAEYAGLIDRAVKQRLARREEIERELESL